MQEINIVNNNCQSVLNLVELLDEDASYVVSTQNILAGALHYINNLVTCSCIFNMLACMTNIVALLYIVVVS